MVDRMGKQAKGHGNHAFGNVDKHSRGSQVRARPRAHQSGKRSSFPWINSQIISASETGGIPHLMAVIMAHLPQMNLVNLSTAIHRLAKLAANDIHSQADLRQNPAFEELLQAVSHALSSVDPPDAQPQSLSNVAWSLATVRSVHQPLLQVVAGLAVTNISAFKPFELSTILWAFAKLSTVDGSLMCLKPVFQAAAVHIMKQIAEFGFRCLATTAWAFATARQRHARLFRSIAAQMVPMVHAANCQEMANTAWAFGTADFHDEQLFAELAEKGLSQLQEFKPQELSNMLWGFATNGFFHEAFFSNASRAAQQMNLQSQHLANIVWAFVRLRPQHPVTHATILSMLPVCTRQLETFKPQEVSSTALAVAKAFSPGDELERSSVPPLPHPEIMMHPQILDFFVAAMSWMLPRLHEFSAQSLANTVSAFTMMRIGGEQALYSSVGQEVLRRFDTFEPTALLHLLKGFSSVPQDEVCAYVTRTLAAGVGRHIDTLRPQEMSALSRICVSLLGYSRSQDLNIDELRACCLQFASSEVDPILQAGIARGLVDHPHDHHRHDLRIQASLALETERLMSPESLGRLPHSLQPPAPPGVPVTKMHLMEYSEPPPPPSMQANHHGHGGAHLKTQRAPLKNQKVNARRGRGNARQPAIANAPYPWLSEELASIDCSVNTPLATIREAGHLAQVPDTTLASGSSAMNPYMDAQDPFRLEQASLGLPSRAVMQPLPGHMHGYNPGSFQWRSSVKNSFLHFEFSDEGAGERVKNTEDVSDDRSSQRSSSVPSRFEYDEGPENFSNRGPWSQANTPSNWSQRYPPAPMPELDYWTDESERWATSRMAPAAAIRTMPPRALLNPDPPEPVPTMTAFSPMSSPHGPRPPGPWRTMSAHALLQPEGQ